MNDQLHQINIAHNAKEDRLLLRISSGGGDEYRLWLTRRYTGLLLGVLNKEMDSRGGAPSVAGSATLSNDEGHSPAAVAMKMFCWPPFQATKSSRSR